MTGPTISVVVPAYNAAETLGTTLGSLLDQTHEALEVLVVDDGSTDATAAVIERAAELDDRIVPVDYGANRGRSFARNEGMRRAGGEWVAMVDADDLIARDRFARMVDATRRFPRTRLVTDDRIGWRLDEGGRVVVEHRFPGRHTVRIGAAAPLDRRVHFTDRFGHLDLLVHRDFLESTAATYPQDMAIGEDLAFYNTLLFWPDDPQPVRVGAPTYYYRLTSSARSAGAPEAHARMVALVVERTGSDELADLYARWGPTHSWLFARADRQLTGAGRLGEPDAAAPVEPAAPNAVTGAAALSAQKAMQWMGRWADRSLRPGITADIERQLRRAFPPGTTTDS